MKINFPDGSHVSRKLTQTELVREDGKRIERLCSHGVGHPIGSVGKWEPWMGTHGCDGCCYKAQFWLGHEGDVVSSKGKTNGL